jgi:hypothetical protein
MITKASSTLLPLYFRPNYQVTNQNSYYSLGRDIAQAVSHRPLTAAAWISARVNPVGFVVDKVALGQVFLRVLRFSPVNIIPPKIKKNSSFIHPFTHPHPGTDKRPVKAAAVQ